MSNVNQIDILKEMKRLITIGWTQGANARDINGFPTVSNPKDNLGSSGYEPVCWCLSGALCYAYDRQEIHDSTGFQIWLQLLKRVENVVDWNDTPGRTQDQVIKVIDACIAELV